MLRFTDTNLKFISDTEMCQFILSMLRGGISIIWKDYAEANNKFVKSCNCKKPSSYVIYLDTNNLYGHSIMQFLPTEILNWVNSKDFSLNNYSEDSPIGCFLEVDLDYPDELHDLHDYSLAGEKIQLRKEMLSD